MHWSLGPRYNRILLYKIQRKIRFKTLWMYFSGLVTIPRKSSSSSNQFLSSGCDKSRATQSAAITLRDKMGILHKLIPHVPKKYLQCRVCKYKNTKFASGEIRRSYYKCSACDVPLCISHIQNCFIKYH